MSTIEQDLALLARRIMVIGGTIHNVIDQSISSWIELVRELLAHRSYVDWHGTTSIGG